MQNLAGICINPDSTDCTHIVIAPKFIAELSYVNGSCETVKGKVTIKWQRNGNKIVLECNIPKGCHGKICLEKGYIIENANSESAFSNGLDNKFIITKS